MGEYTKLFERAGAGYQPPRLSMEALLRRGDRKRLNQRIMAGVVGVAIFVAGVWFATTIWRFDRTQAPAVPGPTAPSPSTGVGFIGLPPKGATPSTPERGKLVLSLDGSSMVWVYADGRLILDRQGYLPEGANEPSTGLLEQRLTPEGIEFLRSEILSSGLFDQDLALARGPDEPFLSIEVRNGDRLVRVTWAWRGNFRIPQGAPTATREQASALEQLHALLTDPASWPASVWQDREIREYAPSRYSVCFRGIPQPIEPSRIWGLLPEPASDLLRAAVMTREESMPSNGDCSQVTTEDAQALAGMLDDDGLVRSTPPRGESWVRYVLEDPDTAGNAIWITFGPVLPHGEATWTGPG